MAILGRTGKTYARLMMQAGPGVSVRLKTRVDWAAWPYALDPGTLPFDIHAADWCDEYAANVDQTRFVAENFPEWYADPFFAVESPAAANIATVT
jgi:hypothetical protein